VRNSGGLFEGVNLFLSKEPDASEVIGAIEAIYKGEDELVFCGYGEPTYRADVMLETAGYAKSKGIPTRLNTNGHGAKIAGAHLVSALKGRIDTVSISLNAADAKKYAELCRPLYGEEGYFAMLDFAKAVKDAGIRTVFSVVDSIGREELEKAERLARDMGIELRIRPLIN
jgi:TatD family-associated radical SAM protein